MRLSEFTNPNVSNTPEANLATALELLRYRYKDSTTPAKISTNALINLVLNTDNTFDYDALVAAHENNPAIQNLIKSVNKDFVELVSLDGESEPDEGDESPADNIPADDNTVSDMATRAAKQRGAPVA